MSRISDALRKTENGSSHLAIAVGHDESNSHTAPPAAEVVSRRANGPGDETAWTAIRSEPLRLVVESPVLPFDGNDPQAAEQYRIIRTKIHHHPVQPRILMVSSPMPGDGKTISAVNLAGALALQEDVQVLLIDADLRRSSVAKLLGLSAAPGLGDVLRGTAPIQEAVIRVGQFPNLYVLAAGEALPNPPELLASARWPALCEQLRSRFRYAILDAPPVGAVADYDLLQLSADGIVLVVRPDHTSHYLLKRALETVPKAKQIGVILNCAEDWFLWRSHSYYYYANGARSS